MIHYDYDDDILMCGNGAGFMAVESMCGIYRAFEETGFIPGRAMCSSGSTLFASLYYSVQTTKWFDALMSVTSPKDFIDLNVCQTFRTIGSGSNFILDNDPVFEILLKNMTGNASKRVTTSVTRNSDWTSHMKQVTPGWSTAATSIPFVFKPVKITGDFWCDGGVLNNLPVPDFESAKKWKHIFVFVTPATIYLSGNFILIQLINLLQAVMDREIQQLQELGFFNLPNVTVIRPQSSFGGSLFSWSPEFTLREESYKQTKGLLKNVKIN